MAYTVPGNSSVFSKSTGKDLPLAGAKAKPGEKPRFAAEGNFIIGFWGCSSSQTHPGLRASNTEKVRVPYSFPLQPHPPHQPSPPLLVNSPPHPPEPVLHPRRAVKRP